MHNYLLLHIINFKINLTIKIEKIHENFYFIIKKKKKLNVLNQNIEFTVS